MIQIDMDMPKVCIDCRFYKKKIYEKNYVQTCVASGNSTGSSKNYRFNIDHIREACPLRPVESN